MMTENSGSVGGRKLLIGAVVLSGAVIAAIAVGYVNQVTPLNLALTDPVSGADMDDMDGGFAGPAQQTAVEHATGSVPMTELATISLGSGVPLPAEIEPPLSATPIPEEIQVAAADTTAWRIQLFSLSSQTNTETAWTRLQQTNPDLLDNLTLHVQPAEL